MPPSEDPAAVVVNAAESIRRLSKLHSAHGDIVAFASTIQNCVRALQSPNHVGHIQNTDIIQKTLLKLQLAIVCHYNDYCIGITGKLALTVLSKFLYSEAERSNNAA